MTRTSPQEKRLRLFEQGNTHCTICLTEFTEPDVQAGEVVTLEHAPQESVGGKPACLTCMQCNTGPATGMIAWIDDIASLPAAFHAAVTPLTDAQLDTPYRPGGWTVRQVVHHVPDSHLNSVVRFKLALTEDQPCIKAYDERAWAALADYRQVPVADSLALLEALHRRWVGLRRCLSWTDFQRAFIHPETVATVTLAPTVGAYAWHGRHHLAQIERLAAREGWSR